VPPGPKYSLSLSTQTLPIMSSPTPKPASGGSIGLIIGLLLLVLLGGEYYMLQHTQDVAQARAMMEAQEAEPKLKALTPQEKLDARIAAAKIRMEERRKARAELKAGKASGSSTYKKELAIKKQAERAERMKQKSQKIKNKLLLKAANFYGKAGKLLRGLLLLGGLSLLFTQSTPEPERGKRKPKPLDPKAVKVMTGICAGVFLIAGFVLLTIHGYSPGFIKYGYPAAAVVALASSGIIGFLWASTKAPKFGLTTERKKVITKEALHFPTVGGGWITIAEPYRGTLVLGGAGAGKTYSIGEPLIEQLAEKNFAGIIYDFKFPVLASVAQKAIVLADRKREEEERQAEAAASSLPGKIIAWFGRMIYAKPEKPVQLHIINFRDMTRTERINPLRAKDLPVVAYAQEYSTAIINNLNAESAKNMDFFAKSAVAYLTSIIWFYKKHFPQFCTIPHVVATAMYGDYRHVLSMLDTDLESGDQARSLISAVQTKADRQTGAILGTLQVDLARINSPELVWVLTPNEANGEGFSLNLNDPENPKLLVIGNDPSLKTTFSPVVSCLITVSIKLMNQQNRHRSYVFMDEAATCTIPDFEDLPNTGRSNLIATFFMTQDLAQMAQKYGKDRMNVMIASLSNHFYGKVNSLETAKFISELIGREDKEIVSTSTGSSTGGTSSRNRSTNESTSIQERLVIRPQDTVTLQQGEFIGQTVGTENPFFQGTIMRPQLTKERFPLHPMVTFGDGSEEAIHAVVQENFLRVRQEVRETINLHVNTLGESLNGNE
jgi:hypothetical protein